MTKIFHGYCMYEVKVTTIRNWRSGPPSLCRARFVAPLSVYVTVFHSPLSVSQEAQVADAGAKTSPDHPDAKTQTPVPRKKVCVLHGSSTPALVRRCLCLKMFSAYLSWKSLSASVCREMQGCCLRPTFLGQTCARTCKFPYIFPF